MGTIRRYVHGIVAILVAVCFAVALLVRPGAPVVSGGTSETRPIGARGGDAAQRRRATLPGLVAADVYGGLTSRGFTLSGPWRSAVGFVAWELRRKGTDAEHRVEIYGSTASAIHTVKATSIPSAADAAGSATAAEFLGSVAGLPYRDAEPARAREWVAANISAGPAMTTIGGARFELSHERGAAYVLKITAN